MLKADEHQLIVDEIAKRTQGDKFLDQNEEREVLRIAMQRGLGIDAAKAAINHVCDVKNYVLESRVLANARRAMEAMAGQESKICEQDFLNVVRIIRQATGGFRSEEQCKKITLGIMRDANILPQTTLFRDWHKRTGKELGIVT